jgi:hypothetical protein
MNRREKLATVRRRTGTEAASAVSEAVERPRTRRLLRAASQMLLFAMDSLIRNVFGRPAVSGLRHRLSRLSLIAGLPGFW